jgi:hypothetical protein
MASPRMKRHECGNMPKSPKTRYTGHETKSGVSWFLEIVCDGRAVKAKYCSWCGKKFETDAAVAFGPKPKEKK